MIFSPTTKTTLPPVGQLVPVSATASTTVLAPEPVPGLASKSVTKPVPAPASNKTFTKVSPVEPSSGSPKTEKVTYKDRLTEAKACVQKANFHLGNSSYLKIEIKKEVKSAIERLYQLVKEAETANSEIGKDKEKSATKEINKDRNEKQQILKNDINVDSGKLEEVLNKLDAQKALIEENGKKMERLKETVEQQQAEIRESRASYASVVSGSVLEKSTRRATLHSLVITAKDAEESGEGVLNRVRQVINAKEGGVEIERVRKAKDRKVIIGCRTEEDRRKVKERILQDEQHLHAEEIKNKDPLVMITGVLKSLKDEDVYRALKNQNKRVFEGLGEEEGKIMIAYKIQGRNPLTQRVVMRVSPALWKRLTELGTVRIDLQTLKVEDRSPLIQCSTCLAFGHGRRLCTETERKCSHCGGLHLRSQCQDYLAGVSPTCTNCVRAKKTETGHNAFSEACPVRARWDELARAAVAYC